MLYRSLPVFLLPTLLAAQQTVEINSIVSNAVGGVNSVFSDVGTAPPAVATGLSQAFSDAATAASFVATAGSGEFSEAATAASAAFSEANSAIGSATQVYGSYATNGAVVTALNSASEIFSEAGATASAQFSSATANAGGATTTGSSSSSAKTGAAAAIQPQVLLGWSAAGMAAVVGGFWQ